MANIRTWLERNGFQRFTELFEENEIDLETLPSLTEDHLKELEIPLGPRVKILKAINLLQSELDAPTDANNPTAIPEPAPLEAERRQITVMFADLADSTSLSSLLDPEDLRDVIKAYQGAVAEAVKQFGGNVAKFMGDGVLCYFGWPVAHEDDAERASLAGLKIVHATSSLTTPTGLALSARVGLATGLVVVGDLIGEGPAQENAIVGETPNLAARLQGAAQPGQVYADQLTRQLAGSPVDYKDLGLQEFKGFTQPIPVWRAVGEATDVSSELQGQQRDTALPSIGRDHEAKLLEAKWQLAKDGEGQAVLLSGEAGIGKSHLMQQMIDTTEDEDIYRMRFQCSPHHINTALYPVVRQFLYASRITDDDSDDLKLDKLKSLLALSKQGDKATTALFAEM
ncbi:AAA family ATPase, partial [Alphaproteobacteria bacterium]|nr:AAA family ATPase [Alphaproteobacteria bacterium]